MASSSESDICKKCNLPKHSRGTASITQWILVCTCDQTTVEDDDSQQSVEICKKCGKRISEGRQGSFTQWILRSDLCDCDFPITVDAADESTVIEEDATPVEEEEELHLAYDEDFPLDRFKPIQLLGKSAFSNVYLSIDRLLNKKVAVKCLLNMTEDLAVQFQKEAKLGTKMNHPNIAGVTDVGLTEKSTPYLVLEYFGGVNLKEFISKNKLSDDETVEIMLQICSGLEHAQSKSILHHDIKSSNILVAINKSGEFEVKIIDFGAGQFKGQKQTEENQFIGTPLYMAPEYAEGKEYDERSEIYSLGCVLFELICGQPPFTGKTSLDILRKHATEPTPSISDFENSINHSGEFDRIIGKCLEKNPENRYASITEIKEDVSNVGVTPEESDTSNDTSAEGQYSYKTYIVSGLLSFLLGASAAYAICFFMDKDQSEKKTKNELHPEVVETKLFELFGKEGSITSARLLKMKDDDLKYLPYYATNLKLMGCPIDGSGLKYLKKNNIKVQSMSVSASLISDKNLVHLRQLRSLRILSLSSCKISTRGLRRIGRLNLRKLFLADCDFLNKRAIPVIVKQFPNLRYLSIGNKNITVSEIFRLRNLRHLQYLKVQLKDLDDDAISELVDFPVKRLGIEKSPITDKGILKLAGSKTLEKLELWECNNVTDIGIEQLQKIRPDLEVERKESFLEKIPQLYNQ